MLDLFDKKIILLLIFIFSLFSTKAQNTRISECSPNLNSNQWHMCHYREDLGGGLIIDSNFINGLPEHKAAPTLQGTYTLIESIHENLELSPVFNLKNSNIYINLPDVITSQSTREFKLLVSLNSENPYRLSKRISVNSIAIDLKFDCTSKNYRIGKISGFFGSMGDGLPLALDNDFQLSVNHEINELNLIQMLNKEGATGKHFIKIISKMTTYLCTPDISQKIITAKINRDSINNIKSAQVVKVENKERNLPIRSSMGNRRALIIGNDTYFNVQKLDNAREDARSIAQKLSALGYDVTLKLDLNEKSMKAAFRIFASQVQGGDEVLFFFAGHGVQLGASNYLLPTDITSDSEAQIRDEAIPLQRVLDDMSEKKAKFTLVMIDACRNNPFKTSGRAIGGRGLAPTTAATGQMIIFSAGTGQQALDKLGDSDKNKNGLFTRILLKEIENPNITVDRVIKNVKIQVANLAQSIGHEQVPAVYDQVLGDFYFTKN